MRIMRYRIIYALHVEYTMWRRWCSDDNSVGELDWVLDGVDSLDGEVFLPHN